MARARAAAKAAFGGRIIGIDLGLANTAAAVVDGLGDGHVRALEFLGTDPRHDLRQMTDDWRRLLLIGDWVRALLGVWAHPTALTVVRFEWFAPYQRNKRGWTTSMVVGVVGAVAQACANSAAEAGEAPIECLPASPPLHVQVAALPKGWSVARRALPHVLDALTHARLEWCRRAGR